MHVVKQYFAFCGLTKNLLKYKGGGGSLISIEDKS